MNQRDNNLKPNDPELHELAAKLAGLVPQASVERHDELLYACGFAAGLQQGMRSLRRWQVAAAVLGLTVAAVSGLAVRGPAPQLAQHVEQQRPSHDEPRRAGIDEGNPRAGSPRAGSPTDADSLAALLDRGRNEPTAPLALDAWQRGAVDEPPVELEAAVHPLSVASLTRSLLPSSNEP
jgi:hypothetical protein